MPLLALLSDIRELNTRALLDAVTANPGCLVEPALCDDSGSVVFEGPFQLPARVDVVPMDNDQPSRPISVTPRTSMSFETIIGSVNGVPLSLDPFGWDYAHFSIQLPSGNDLDCLVAWFYQWFDLEDQREADGTGLMGVVHFMSDPVRSAGGVVFTVDFGSSSVDCFVALLDVLVRAGATTIVVG